MNKPMKCNSCYHPGCWDFDPCGACDPCDPCAPAKYGCSFNINADPYDKNYWLVEFNGCTARVKLPPINETCTHISIDDSTSTLVYKGECGTEYITGEQLGSIIDLGDLKDVIADNPAPCSLLVWNPNCDLCEEGCQPIEPSWRPYVIPDAGDCIMEADTDGYYHVLTKDECGCPIECRLPVIPDGMTVINYVRDSVPDDPDFPWYYGSYNDRINLHLAENASQYFGKFDLKVTVNYGVQAIKSDYCPNYNWRSLVVPVAGDESIRVTQAASILQGFAISAAGESGEVDIPWGSASLRGGFSFVVPKGEEAYLHHEYRVRTNDSFPNYYTCPADGKRVPDNEAGLNQVRYPASRLNALQVIVEPTQGSANYEPVADAERDQLDAPTDEYPPIA